MYLKFPSVRDDCRHVSWCFRVALAELSREGRTFVHTTPSVGKMIVMTKGSLRMYALYLLFVTVSLPSLNSMDLICLIREVLQARPHLCISVFGQ